MNKPHADKRHESLAFLSERFGDRQLRWSILEKEAFAILASLHRMHWLVATPEGFDICTDNHNIIFIFDPLSLMPHLSQSSIKKVMRWAVLMNMYNYACIHMPAVDNVWADLLGRWSAPPSIRRIISVPPLVSSQSDDFEWPTAENLQVLQQKDITYKPDNLHPADGLYVNDTGTAWIPDAADDFQLRMCIAGHTGPAGHRGCAATTKAIKKHFFWSSIQTFVKSCIHCLPTVGGNKVPRPLGAAVHGTKPNDLLQFDYIEMAPSKAGEKYILMLRDDFSSYCWLISLPRLKMQRRDNRMGVHFRVSPYAF